MATKKTTKAAKSETKAAKKAPAKKAKGTANGKLSALDAAAKVLGESAEPMNAKSLIETMASKGYWTSPGGQTPHATLFAAITREIQVKGTESRFAKADRGQFALNGGKMATAAKPAKAKKSKAKEADASAAEANAAAEAADE